MCGFPPEFCKWSAAAGADFQTECRPWLIKNYNKIYELYPEWKQTSTGDGSGNDSTNTGGEGGETRTNLAPSTDGADCNTSNLDGDTINNSGEDKKKKKKSGSSKKDKKKVSRYKLNMHCTST